MRFCMRCMEQYDDGLKVCPECGFVEGTQPFNTRCIEPGQILGDRYIVGMPLNIDGWFVKYIGWDALTDRKVTIYEYSPTRFAARNIGDSALTVLKEKEFYKYMERFAKKAQLLGQLHLPENVADVYEIFEKNNTTYVVTEYVEGRPLSEYIEKNGAVSPQMTEKMFLPILRSIDTLHESGFVIGGFSPYDLLVLDDGSLFLNSYLENILFNATDDRSDITQKDRQKYFSYERLKAADSPSQLPANDVYSAAVIMHRMMGVPLPEAADRDAYYEKTHKDRLKMLSAYRVKLDSSKEAALRNASYVDSAFRTADMDNFIKELSGEKKVTVMSKKGPRLPMWAKIAIPAVCAALIAGGAVMVIMKNRAPKDPEKIIVTSETLDPELAIVPDVVKLDTMNAANTLGRAGLLIEIAERVTDDEVSPDTVLSQSLEPGSLTERNTVVGVSVSVGSRTAMMPNLIGLDSQTACELLDALDIGYTGKEAYDSSVAAGCVISQSIPPYQPVRKDDEPEIVISLGCDPSAKPEEKTVKIPDFVGRSYEEAAAEAGKLGIPVAVVKRVFDDSRPEGTVTEQDPPAGTEQKNTLPVKLLVSTTHKGISLPDLTFLTRSDAEKLLSGLGLTAEIREEPSDLVAEGLVASQQPEAGKEAAEGDKVILTVSKGRAEAVMPDVTGLSPEEAVKKLTDAGISPKIVYGGEDSSKPEGSVSAQSIAPGKPVSKGEPAVITVSTRDELEKVPALLGLTKDEAAEKLAKAGFGLKVFVGSEQLSEGRVGAQSPAAGAAARKGSEITVILVDDAHACDISLSPGKAEIPVGGEFTLVIRCQNIRDLVAVNYDLSEQGIIEPTYIDKQTLDMTFKGLKAGEVTITISYGGIERNCTVTVT